MKTVFMTDSNSVVEALKMNMETRFSNCDRTKLRIGAAGAALTEEERIRWKEMLQKAFPEAQVL